MTVKLDPIEDIERATAPGKWDEHVASILALPKKAAAFIVEESLENIEKFQRTFRAAANKVEKSARFGTSTAVDATHTRVQVKLVDKTVGRPAGEVVGEDSPESGAPVK